LNLSSLKNDQTATSESSQKKLFVGKNLPAKITRRLIFFLARGICVRVFFIPFLLSHKWSRQDSANRVMDLRRRDCTGPRVHPRLSQISSEIQALTVK
jgi:fructose 1,6-bisphosphatase